MVSKTEYGTLKALFLNKDYFFIEKLYVIKYLKAYNLYNKLQEKVRIIKPVGYLDFLPVMNNARKILTDSGGIQKEAYMLQVPCITLRENTEWIETVEDGWNVLVGADKDKIVNMIRDFNTTGLQREVFGK